MINEFQKLVYKLSCIAPICIILAVSLYTQRCNIIFCIFLGFVGISGCVYAIFFIRLCEKKLPKLRITVDGISQDDTSVIAYLTTYLIPLIGVVWKNDLFIWILIAVCVIILGIKMNNLSFCPILLLAGYHCYKASLTTGTECILISREKVVRSNKQFQQVIRISDTMMLVERGGRGNV